MNTSNKIDKTWSLFHLSNVFLISLLCAFVSTSVLAQEKNFTKGLDVTLSNTASLELKVPSSNVFKEDGESTLSELGIIPLEITELLEDKDNRDSGKGGRIPLILIHGINGIENLDDGKNREYWLNYLNYFYESELKNYYKIYRFNYLSNKIPIVGIAQGLREWIDTLIQNGQIEDREFVIVAHSMGGLVARSYMNEQSHSIGNYSGKLCGERILRLITLATPHHGTPLANSESRDELARWGWQGFLNLVSLKYWEKTSKEIFGLTIPTSIYYHDESNRSDLRWDNYDGFMNNEAEDMNRWLQDLNSKELYGKIIIGYAGELDPENEDKSDLLNLMSTENNQYYQTAKPILDELVKLISKGNFLLEKSLTSLIDFTAEYSLRYATLLGYAWNKDPHNVLLVGNILLTEGMCLSSGFPWYLCSGGYLYTRNDGVVPLQSAIFSTHSILLRRLFKGHDHGDMKDGKFDNDSKSILLFVKLTEDLNSCLNTTKPTISIISPTSGSTVSDSITITTTVSNNVSKVEFYFNDSNKFTDSSNPFERVWNTKDYANGDYTIKAIAFDINGNASEPAIVTVTVNNTSSNKPPNTPTDLAQYKSNGATSIAIGSSTNERTVVMKGKVTDPDNNPVSLEVEFKPIGTSFSNVPSPEGVSGGTVASGQIAVVTCSGLADGQYHWQARAKDSKGSVSNWVSAGGNSESVPDFIVSASSLKVGDWVQTNALVNVRDTPGGNLIKENMPVGSIGQIKEGPQAANFENKLYTWWRIQWDDQDKTFGWSIQDPLVPIGNYPPLVTVNAPNGGEILKMGTPYEIKWAATDTTGTIQRIDIYRSNDDGGSWSTIASNEANDGSYLWTPLTQTTQGRIKVEATDSFGSKGNDMSNGNFSVVGNCQAPAVPTLYTITPSSNSYYVTWSDTSGASYYNLQEDDSSSFSSPTVVYTNNGTSWYSGDKLPGTYYYRVKAINDCGVSDWSNTQSVIIQGDQGPGEITALNPADNAKDQPLTVTLQWNASHAGGESLRYNVYVVEADTTIFYPNNIKSYEQTGKTYSISSIPYNTVISWGIEAIDDTGDRRFSSMFHFTTIGDNGAPIGSILINNGAASTTSYSVTLNLSATDSGSGVKSMRLSNDGTHWTYWVPFSTQYSWNLADTNYGGQYGLATYTVYAQFNDYEGNESQIYSDTIAKVTAPPGQILLNRKVYQNIQDAINAANSGDTVYLTEGIYEFNASVIPTNHSDRTCGIQMKPGVALIGAGAIKTTIDVKGSAFAAVIDANNSVIEGVTIINSGSLSQRYVVLLESNSSKIKNCTIKGGATGIHVGFGTSYTALSAEIANNLIINNSQPGIWLESGNNTYLYNNTIASNDSGGYGGIYGYIASANIVNNIIANNGIGVRSSDSPSTFKYNDVYGNGTNYSGSIANQTGTNGNISSDPSFVNVSSGDCRLNAGSPCISAGTNVGIPFDGGAPDMGAFEYNGVGTIQVTSNRADASFTIKGPSGAYNGSGTGWSLSNLPIGIYTITFTPITNLYSPLYQAKMLYSGQTLSFNGDYQANSDTVGPTGTLSVNFNEYATADKLVTVTFDITDEVGGLGDSSQMMFSNDGVTWSTPGAYSSLKKDWDVTLFGGNATSGEKTVYAKVSDVIGNWSTFTDTIKYVPDRKVLEVPIQYSTIQSAIDAALDGDMVYVYPGDHGGWGGSITLKEGIRLQGAGPLVTVFNNGLMQINMARNSMLDGFSGYMKVNCADGRAIVSNNWIRRGISAYGQADTIIRNNVVTEYSLVMQGTVKVVIENNTFANSIGGLKTAIYLDSATPETKIYLKNNIIANNSIGVSDKNTADTFHQHIFPSFNTYWNNTKNFEGNFNVMGTGDDNADPLFLNLTNNDFHLKAGSPAINSGNPETRYNDPDGTRNDRGDYGGPSLNTPPKADFSTEPALGGVGTVFTFDGSLSTDIESKSDQLRVRWDLDGDNNFDTLFSINKKIVHQYDAEGNYNVTIEVQDKGGFVFSTAKSVAVINQTPNVPSNPTPADGATGQPRDIVLRWNGGDADINDTVAYDVYFGTTSNPPLISSDQPDTSLQPGVLLSTTTYYWKIVAKDNHSKTSIGPLWYFTTAYTDAIQPQGTISINNNETYTTSKTVTLNLYAADNIGITGYYVSENPSAPQSSDTNWISVNTITNYSANIPYVLSSGDGNKKVFVWYKDATGNVSAVANDSINLDTIAPTVISTTPANGATGVDVSSAISATFSEVMDSLTVNTSTFMVKGNSGNVTGTVSYSGTTATFTPLNKLVYSTTYTATITTGIKDAAGNPIASVYTWSFTTNELPVITSFQINGGAVEAANRTVTLNNTVTGSPTDYMASESSGFNGTNWQTYSIAPSFTLSTGDGVKNVYFKVKNGNGESVAISDSITLKELPAVSTFQINNGATEVTNRMVILNNTATGSPTEYIASESANFSNAAWLAYTVAPSFTLSTGDGAKTVYFKVKNANGESAVVNDSITLKELHVTPKIAGGEFHTISLKSDGTVWAWGRNSSGQLGDGTTTARSTSAQVISLSDITAIAGGYSHSIALKSDGTVWAWGYNYYGQLGDGTNTTRKTPVQVIGLSDVTAIAGGGYYTLALKSDGTVWAWGRNDFGQLGDGSYTDRKTPVQVIGLSDVTAIAGGCYHTLALKSDGTVWAWGRNDYGQLGDGTTTTWFTPVQVSSLNGVIAIAGGGYHTVALKLDGTVWAWGSNSSGQLGDGTYTAKYTPMQVSSFSGVIAIAGGSYHTIALKSDGTVWTWGLNNYGQLGDGTTTTRKTPVLVSSLSSVIAIAGGYYHTLVLKSDGTVLAWGRNNYGQLGDGTTVDNYLPVLVDINLGEMVITPTVMFCQINNGASETTSRAVILNNTATGIPTNYMASESASFADATWLTYTVAPSFTLSAGDGAKTVYFKVMNAHGESVVISDAITLKEFPVVSTLQVNNGASETTSRTVTLDNTATGSPTDYMASESSSFAGASWQTYAVAPSFTLSAGDGAKKVYFKVKNVNGESVVANDSITLKEYPVVSTFQVNNGATETTSSIVTLNNTATGSPTHYMASESASFADAIWKTYAVAPSFTLSTGSGVKTVYFKVKNVNGESAVVSDAITLKELSVVSAFLINGGATQTTSRTVTLNNTATGSPTEYIASELTSFADAIWLAYTAAPSFTLSTGDGAKTVYFKVRNVSGESAAKNDGIILKEYPVVSTLQVNNGEAETTSRTVTLNNTATGSPTHYMASESSGFNSTWQTYTIAPSFTLGSGDGPKTVYFKVKNANSESAAVSDTIILKELPVVSKFQINNGTADTASRAVTLNNTAAGNPTEYMASEMESFADATWRTYTVAPGFTLSAGDGVKTIYFKVKNVHGESAVLSDGITLKEMPEVSTLQVNNGAAETTSRTVTLNNTATGSPTHYVASESSKFNGASWQTYATEPTFTLSTGDGSKTVYFKVKNDNGESAVLSDVIALKEFPVASTFQINSGTAETTSRTVTLNNTATGSPTHYMASESSSFTDATWQTYAVAPSFTLSMGDELKTVYFKVKNTNGESPVLKDGITLKEYPIVTTLKINNGAAETTISTVTLNNTATGNPTHYMASELTSFADATWLTYTEVPAFTLSTGGGVKTVYFKVKNGNGDSAVVSDTITLKELPVVSTFQINNGAADTTSRKVTLNSVATGSPTQYMSSESATFASTKWKKYKKAIKFTMSASLGVKTVYFKVKNATGESAVVSDTITLKKALTAVVADAGVDQLVRKGSVITLDGSRSFSSEENVPLAYQWGFVSLSSGMGSLLSDFKSANPTFTLKRQGRCEIQLIVKDSMGTASEPDTVVISTQDTTPVAHAGSDQFIREVGTRVMLNGAQSYDSDGDALAYQWSFISMPAESAASLENADTVRSAFVADAPGDYVIQLMVTDSQARSSSATVTVSFGNVRPMANAGKSLAVKVGDTVTLAGDGTDANGDALSYRWMLSALPDGSLSELADSSARVTRFTPDRAGVYVAQLVVSDGDLDSKPCAIQIQAFTTQTKTIAALQGLETDIAALDSSTFRNDGMQNVLLNKLNAVIANVEAGKHADAANQLRNDVLPKMGGVENAEGDSVVWIIDRSSQNVWYQEVQDVVRLLEMAR